MATKETTILNSLTISIQKKVLILFLQWLNLQQQKSTNAIESLHKLKKSSSKISGTNLLNTRNNMNRGLILISSRETTNLKSLSSKVKAGSKETNKIGRANSRDSDKKVKLSPKLNDLT